MIQHIEKIIRDKGLCGDEKLSFLKYATPASGRHLDDKVLFFVFRDTESTPFLCIKTIRSYYAHDVLVHNFFSLKKVHTLTKCGPYEDLFVEALFLYDDGEFVWSVERVGKGKRMRFTPAMVKDFVSTYTHFQKSIIDEEKPRIEDVCEYVKNTIETSKLSPKSKEMVTHFLQELPSLPLAVPAIMQHGDLSQDNILVSQKQFHVIDCDYTDLIYLPGFDIFHFIYRHHTTGVNTLLEESLSHYFEIIGVNISKEQYKQLYVMYYLLDRVVRKPHELEKQTPHTLVLELKTHLGI